MTSERDTNVLIKSTQFLYFISEYPKVLIYFDLFQFVHRDQNNNFPGKTSSLYISKCLYENK